ncbi:MAG: hypothetical protein OXP66_02565 [Candidatus Tectomicrobia bacterium]|nr:hypothetical protein [Candidatus Tectomicrobia bacterium]
MAERKVVVPIHLTYFHNEEAAVIVAHSEDFGLTGYGRTDEGALESFKRVFSAFIGVSRSEGFLENMLNRIGVAWRWADEYEEDYEDVSGYGENPGERSRKSSGGNFVPVPSKRAKELMAA